MDRKHTKIHLVIVCLHCPTNLTLSHVVLAFNEIQTIPMEYLFSVTSPRIWWGCHQEYNYSGFPRCPDFWILCFLCLAEKKHFGSRRPAESWGLRGITSPNYWKTRKQCRICLNINLQPYKGRKHIYSRIWYRIVMCFTIDFGQICGNFRNAFACFQDWG